MPQDEQGSDAPETLDELPDSDNHSVDLPTDAAAGADDIDAGPDTSVGAGDQDEAGTHPADGIEREDRPRRRRRGDRPRAPRVRSRRHHRLVRVAQVVVVMGLASALALVVAPRQSVSAHAVIGQVIIEGRGEGGTTRLEVPPVGAVQATTHSGPLGVAVRLSEIDIDRLGDLEEQVANDSQLRDRLEEDLGAAAWSWVRMTLATATGLGLVAGLVVASVSERRLKATWGLAGLGALTGLVVFAGAAVVTQRSFDAEAFANPRYEGALRYAPDVLAEVGGAVSGIEQLDGTASVVANRIEALARIGTGTGTTDPGTEELVLLHVSDLHLNPLAVRFVNDLADQFAPDAVIDTGDFTSYGFDVEASFVDLIDVDVPYYLVPGNHDSIGAREALAASGVVQVVDGAVVDIRGLRLLGVSDPTFTPLVEPPPWQEQQTVYAGQVDAVSSLLETEVPDVLAVHSPAQARGLEGQVPVVMAGHIHRFRLETSAGTTLAVVGSTGANGLRSLTFTQEPDYQAQLLRFVQEEGRWVLRYIDRIEIDEPGLLGIDGGRFRLERIPISPEAGAAPELLAEGGGAVEEGPISTPSDPVEAAIVTGAGIEVVVGEGVTAPTLPPDPSATSTPTTGTTSGPGG